jgi:hypothetical protein
MGEPLGDKAEYCLSEDYVPSALELIDVSGAHLIPK